MVEPVRVIQVVTQMNRAGLECRLMDIYRKIDRNRVQFDFYTCSKNKGFFDEEIVSMGGRIYYNDPLSTLTIYRISSIFKNFFVNHPEYKIAHCHLNQWCGWVLKGAYEANINVRIAHSRTALQTSTLKNIIKNFIKISVNKYATHLFAVSNEAGEWLYGKSAIKEGKVDIWPNAIDCSKYIFNENIRRRIRAELDLGDAYTIIHVGNLRPEKNHSFLLRVFAEIKKQEPNSKLVLVGNVSPDSEYHKLATQLDISKHVLFLGSRSDVPELLQAGDVFVFPSFYEGFPGAVLEAQAAGLPCIISDSITSEVCVTPLVKQMSLGLPTEVWAAEILKQQYTLREDMYSPLVKAGYDIDALAKKMTEFYEKNRDIINC